MTNPYALICWEAQFGDFMNTTQVQVNLHYLTFLNIWAKSCNLIGWKPLSLGQTTQCCCSSLCAVVQFTAKNIVGKNHWQFSMKSKNDSLQNLSILLWLNCFDVPADYMYLLLYHSVSLTSLSAVDKTNGWDKQVLCFCCHMVMKAWWVFSLTCLLYFDIQVDHLHLAHITVIGRIPHQDISDIYIYTDHQASLWASKLVGIINMCSANRHLLFKHFLQASL